MFANYFKDDWKPGMAYTFGLAKKLGVRIWAVASRSRTARSNRV